MQQGRGKESEGERRYPHPLVVKSEPVDEARTSGRRLGSSMWPAEWEQDLLEPCGYYPQHYLHPHPLPARRGDACVRAAERWSGGEGRGGGEGKLRSAASGSLLTAICVLAGCIHRSVKNEPARHDRQKNGFQKLLMFCAPSCGGVVSPAAGWNHGPTCGGVVNPAAGWNHGPSPCGWLEPWSQRQSGLRVRG
ncbi:hypothetical protein ACOMHN_026851 [Nucella lapillus]